MASSSHGGLEPAQPAREPCEAILIGFWAVVGVFQLQAEHEKF
jgi:hypothetical protein